MALVASRDLIKKLLHLYPVSFLKEHFNQTGNQADIVDVLSANPIDTIVNFAVTYQSTTKQNIYIFTLNRDFDGFNDMVDFPLDIAFKSTDLGTYALFPETTYSVYVTNPPAREEISFLQPIIIKVDKKSLIISFTKLKKDIKTYYKPDKEPKVASERGTEEERLRLILSHFASTIGYSVNDLNKGIKFLWDKDILDCRKITYMDAKSTTVTTMNGELTFKQEHPDKYKDMKHTPIGSSNWRFLNEDTQRIKEFKCDPSAGTLDINKYSDNAKQVNNVVTTILTQN